MAENPIRAKDIWRKYAFSEKDTITLLLNYAKDRSRRNNLPFDLEPEWLLPKIQMMKCELGGLDLERVSPGKFRTHPFAPSLDRVIPDLGYIKTNTRLVCFAVNRARSDWGDEILMKIAQALVKVRN